MAVKKVAKKGAKKPTKKVAKKVVKKPAKKVAKKPAKKVAKKVVKKPAKKVAKKPAKKKTAAKRKPNPEFMKPMQVSDALAKVVGSRPLPRTEVTKKLWQYIKKNNLQDPVNRRNINADENLKEIFGGKKTVTMFEMTKLVNKHLS